MIKRQFTRLLRNIASLAGIFAMTFVPLTSHAQIYNQGQNYTVDINKTQIMHLPAPASAIVVGNTAIADVSVHSPNLLFIIGRGYGVTNVIVLNDLGQTIVEADIQVKNSHSNTGKRVMLVGQGWQSYECSPFCQPAPVLSDDPGFVAQFRGGGQAIDNTGTPVTSASFPTTSSNSGVPGSALPSFQPPALNSGLSNPTVQRNPLPTPLQAQRQPE
ncbi:MAG: pilus assembly protein N-terminal domain-containing protein [Robiginitomaculum sp.]|nr:pilus assembly protein N-terminal domain-containing protein [Robiginitomaculum sp.]